MKKLFLWLFAVCIVFSQFPHTFAADSLQVIPETKSNWQAIWQNVDCVAWNGSWAECTKWSVRDRYNAQAEKYDGTANRNNRDIGACFASGIFSWNCVLDYLVYIIKFLSEVALLIGAIMIMWAWYKYATAVFSWKSPDMWIVKNAIIWVLIVIFSFAIIKALSSAFL